MSATKYPVYDERYGWGWPPGDYTDCPDALPKPRLYLLFGTWWCHGPKASSGLFCGGSGETPSAAYMSWASAQIPPYYGIFPWVLCKPTGEHCVPRSYPSVTSVGIRDTYLDLTTTVVQNLLQKSKP